MSLDNEDRKALINYRQEKADMAFIEVERADIDEYTPQVTALVNKLKDLVEV